MPPFTLRRLGPGVPVLAALLAACQSPPAPPVAMDSPPMSAVAPPAAPVPVPAGPAAELSPRLVGRGFAQVSGQPGRTVSERRLLAVRAARLEALRDLAEQVHGIRLSADTLVRDAVVQDDRLAAGIVATLRGARTLSIQPRGEDGYEVTMELDAAGVALVMRMVRAGA